MNFPVRILIFCLLSCTLLPAQDSAIRLVSEGDTYILEWQATDAAQAGAGIQVFVGEWERMPDRTQVAGSDARSDGRVRFQPAFGFRAGVTYTAFAGDAVPLVFTIPRSGPPPQLTEIWPSADTLPANLLKIYLHFSTPMGEGRAYAHLHLVRSDGDTIFQPFVPLQPELWSADRRRLTLWLDPGRVKRGLLSNQRYGAVLTAGQSYTLHIDSNWRGADGQTLVQAYAKTFFIQDPDYDQPQIDRWQLSPPAAGSTDPVIVDLGEPVDAAMALRLISLLDDAGEPVEGRAALVSGASHWQYYPARAWRPGTYAIRVDSSLEDLAGNSLLRSFDRDLLEQSKEGQIPAFYLLDLEIKAPE